ncbi:hypothetical protein RFI_36544 [Reticulomyxa filosa]|uniref:Uncharacterized protein n=1 Tax=Reticulomyxa filosa TaxID=46433 RepID=X6LHT6_RETFI|nr:hypothetical protein RFI_36544 [Reticulomyxa filosa]|eukprot:ETO00896.1 hypothetical protein RFI_36544 [Reticulomyxa filosa]
MLNIAFYQMHFKLSKIRFSFAINNILYRFHCSSFFLYDIVSIDEICKVAETIEESTKCVMRTDSISNWMDTILYGFFAHFLRAFAYVTGNRKQDKAKVIKYRKDFFFDRDTYHRQNAYLSGFEDDANKRNKKNFYLKKKFLKNIYFLNFKFQTVIKHIFVEKSKQNLDRLQDAL